MSWPEVSFLSVCDIQGGTQPPKSEFIENWKEGYVRILQIQDFKRDDRQYFIPETSKLKKCEDDDILIARYGASLGKILTGKSGAYNVAIVKTIPDLDKLDKKYLYHYLQSPHFQNFIAKVGRRAAQAGFNKENLSRLMIRLPPLKEQKRITAILDKANVIKLASEQANALRNTFIDSVYNEFSDSSDSIRMTIQQLIDEGFITLHKDGNHGSEYPRKSEFGEEGIPFLSANCFDDSGNFIPSRVKLLNPQKAMRLKHGRILKNDVLLAHNATVGRVALYDGRFESAMIGTSLTCFRCDDMKLNPLFLFTAFRSLEFQMQLEKNMGQSTRNQVPITSQRKLSINVPQINVQNLVASLVDNANNSFDSIANQVDLSILLNESSSQQIIS